MNGCQCRDCKKYHIVWKTPEEVRAAGEERCRIRGCGVPLTPSRTGGHLGSCGNHEIDRPKENLR